MKRSRFLIYIIIVMLILPGCTIQRNQATKIEKKDKAPKSLGDLNRNLQDLLDDNKKIEEILDDTYIEEKPKEKEKLAEDNPEEKQQGGQGGQTGGQSGQGGQGAQGGQGGQGKQEEKKPKEEDKEKKKSEDLIKTWEAMDKKIEELHKGWNGYEGEASKKGATKDKIEKISTSLNLLTKAIENRKVPDIYNFASQSMLNISAAFDLYKDEIWGEINKIKYATYQSYLKAIGGDNTAASKLLEDSKEEINKIRLKLEKDNSKIKALDKVNLSIGDMQDALKEKSLKLIRIKKDIILKNLEDLGK